MTSVSALPNPHRPAFWVRPAAEIDADLAHLRSIGPVLLPGFDESDVAEDPSGLLESMIGSGWVVTSHAHILEVSKNPTVFRSGDGMTMLDTPPEFNDFFGSMISMDDPRHARLRRLVSPGFTPKRLQALEESVVEQADLIIDEVCERGECDFVVDVAARLPLKIVCDLMGVPDSQVGFVFDRTNVILGASDPEFMPEDGDVLSALLVAGQELAGLMTEVAASKEGGDGTDLTTQLVNAEIDGEKLTHAEIASFFILLVVAGNETTRNAISWGLTYLTDNEAERARWMADVPGMTPTAVEEIVRLASPVTYMRRTATQDTMLGEAEISAGDKVIQYYLAANRDETVFDDPLSFDVGRSPNPHVGFGGPGPHFCLGAHLARREIGVMFARIFDRLPDVVASGEPSLLQSSFIHGVKHLPATFTPTAPRS